MNIKQSLWATVAFLGLAACGASKNKNAVRELTGKQWELSAIGTTSYSGTKKPTLFFTDSNKSVGGYSGCNTFGSKYTLKEDKLRFDEIIATQMSCLNNMDVEEKIYQGLQKTDNFKIASGLLQLRQGKVVLLEYRKGKVMEK